MNNVDDKKANLIFDKWKADLKEMDRSKASVEGNFDMLFSKLKDSKVEFDVAHNILSKAITAHYPNQAVIDNVYKRIKIIIGTSKQEFAEDWKENIAAGAKRVFYSLYEIDGEAKDKDDDDDGEPKQYGSMSASEYRKQRAHIESYPLLDWTKIKLEPMSIEDLQEMENMANSMEDDNE